MNLKKKKTNQNQKKIIEKPEINKIDSIEDLISFDETENNTKNNNENFEFNEKQMMLFYDIKPIQKQINFDKEKNIKEIIQEINKMEIGKILAINISEYNLYDTKRIKYKKNARCSSFNEEYHQTI
ncbi:hypothetical protein M0811_03701 [Anaeramoeba ignava]|uniref:Uncharacterized protein n=1 Tax=Anaeramoeba ignava TaxID=1746090 RepID=A0A9Q0RHG6_ANAIG|nr:hypothetical protein M0811_03701 [Anaeramoeba ignava]